MVETLKAVIQDAIHDPVFTICALVAIVAAVVMITRRNPVYSALWLMQCFLAVAVIFLKLNAPFLAAIHVLVYTGAILVLFLFVIMLLNLQPHEYGVEHSVQRKGLMALVCVGLMATLSVAFLQSDGAVKFPELRPAEVGNSVAIAAADWGGVEHIGHDVFTRFVVPFEIVSILIIVAILGAVVLAKRKL